MYNLKKFEKIRKTQTRLHLGEQLAFANTIAHLDEKQIVQKYSKHKHYKRNFFTHRWCNRVPIMCVEIHAVALNNDNYQSVNLNRSHFTNNRVGCGWVSKIIKLNISF